jgi:hypothetical protein
MKYDLAFIAVSSPGKTSKAAFVMWITVFFGTWKPNQRSRVDKMSEYLFKWDI